VGAGLFRWQWGLIFGVWVTPVGSNGSISAFDFLITGFDLPGVEVEESQRLAQDEKVLFPPGTGEGFGDLGFILLAAIVAQGRQFVRVAFPGHNRPDNVLACLSGDVAEYLRELNVHVQQGLLHVQNVRAAVLDQLCPVTQQSAQGNQVGFRTEGVGQQAITVQGLDPLAVQHVSFPTRKAFDGSGSNQATLEAIGFEGFEERNPVHPSGLHRHTLDAMPQEPLSNVVQVGSIGAKGAHDLGVVWPWDTHHDFMRPDVQPGGVGLDTNQTVEGANFDLRSSL